MIDDSGTFFEKIEKSLKFAEARESRSSLFSVRHLNGSSDFDCRCRLGADFFRVKEESKGSELQQEF